MKKNLLLLSGMFVAFAMNAQFSVHNDQGGEIQDGDVIVFDTYEYPAASIDFHVTNEHTEDIYTRIEFVDAINADGSMFELCYGDCYTGLAIGDNVPPAPDYITIAPGLSTGQGNHFYNFDPGNGSETLDYIFKFYQVEADGTTVTGTPLTFTYRYAPVLGQDDLSKVDLTIQSTIVSNELVLKVNETMDMVVYDLQGRIVKQQMLEVGNQRINMSDLSSQAYILQFKTERGATQTTKIVVQ